MRLSRRRFIAISAATAATPLRAAPVLRQFRGTALGAKATLTLGHPDAPAIAARVFAEIDRLEDIFSLYRQDSDLSRLNRKGVLSAPPFELLECLSLCGAVHRATGGRFDPTIQPLWAAHAEAHSSGRLVAAADLAVALRSTGWQNLDFDEGAIAFRQPGMALSLNGVAQGYIADQIAGLLRADGLTDILIDTGELHALGGSWPVTLAAGGTGLDLRDLALASSAPLGTTFDAEGTVSHILDPLTGHPAPNLWRLISITAPRAALADALSTAACLMDEPSMNAALAQFPKASLVARIPA